MPNTLETVLNDAKALSAVDKVRLVERLLPEVEEALERNGPGPRRDWKGAFGDKGPTPTEDDISEMRREAWGAS